MEEGFLRDICAHPDDVAPRLVYADWLDERARKGDAERAEFIRLQCRLDAEPEMPRKQREALQKREEELLEAWKKVWNRPFKGLFSVYEYRRGFLERGTLKATTFIKEGDRILGLTPLRFVKLRDPKHYFDGLARTKALTRLAGLSLNYGQMGAWRSETFLASRHLGTLRWLDLGNNNIGQSGARKLAKAKLDGLRFLALDDNNLRDAGVEALAASKLLGHIEALILDNNDLTDAALHALAGSPHAGRLAQLHLSRNNDLTAEGFRALLTSPRLPALRWVHQYSSLDHEAARQLKEEFPGRFVYGDGYHDHLEDGPVAKP
jgi:uncharacterized protein (TIGR02996 family)